MPLHKSFSEQNRHPKRQQWQRSKSHSAIAQPARGPKLPDTVSEVTKNKLQKFQFQPNSVGGDTPELASRTPLRRRGLPEHATVITIEDDSDKENNVRSGPEKISPPTALNVLHATTPIAKLVWQDLMGLNDLSKEEEDASPSDRLLWHNERDSFSSAISPMLPKRNKKRARSSSPTSSPVNSKQNTPAVNFKGLREALKSPNADPALDLWDRFSLCGTSNTTPIGMKNPVLAHLMASSSPRPTKDGTVPQNDSNLRRAISCGMHWPKRRKIEKCDYDSPIGRPKTGTDTASKSSMVTALLETVTGEISRSNALAERRQTSKSPSPAKYARHDRSSASSGAESHRPRGILQSAAPQSPTSRRTEGTVSDDYGDDDFDEDTLMEIDASLFSLQSGEPSRVTHQEPQVQTEPKAAVSEDEFGDLDDDIFAAAEDLIAEIDSKQTSQSRFQGSQATKRRTPHGSPAKRREWATEDAYGDDFGADFDFEAAELAATQSAKTIPGSTSLPHSSQKPRAIQRYLVTNVLESCYTDDRGREHPEKVLIVQAERTSSIKTVHLRGDWIDTPASTKSYVHVVGTFESTGACIINNTQNVLILHPDQLISSTVVADSFSCMRRAVLQDRVKATSDSSPALVYGTLLHEIFQEALMANSWDSCFLGDAIDRTINKHLEDLYTIKVQVQDAREHLASKMRELQFWAQEFISSQPKPNALVQGRNGEKINMCISKLLDVEEHVWSPMYGLKGNIDATVQVTMKDGKDSRTLTVPFELKTGKNASTNHQAQTVLYNLLLSDRYDIDIVYGILYYMETSQTLRIPAIRHELRHMIMQRNQLAGYIRERSVQLPDMKKSKNVCGKCYAQTSCFIYHKLADDGDGETSGMANKFDDVVKHLTPTHRDFFLKWEDLLTKEEKESQKLRRELWTMVSSEREKLGRCFGHVVIQDGSASEDANGSKINRFHYTFNKEKPLPGFSFMDSQLGVGEPIVVSDEQGHFALALGYVTSVRKQRISVAVDRRLHNARIKQPGFDEVSNQVFASVMEVADDRAQPLPSRGNIEEAAVRYRLDKDEFSNGMALVRNNLVQAMADNPFRSRDIRRLVVDLAPPAFKAVSTQYTISDRDSLNVDQEKAIEKVMSAKDYALVLGMPGTGKTTTIAHIIRALVCQKKSVLLTSYTHTAVDNILLKLKTDNIPILRLGAPAKVHPEVQEFVFLAGQPKTSFEEIREAWHDTPVVATTCLGISHPIFNERTFDYCIVDEASQITLPICLGPIRMANTFVLVGDHNQLPPLVQNEEARQGGLDVSLFKLLSDKHPQSVVNLEHQYRMCEDIMTLSNTLIYNGRLKCGTEALRYRSLDIPNMLALRRHHHDASSVLGSTPKSICTGSPCWLRDLLDPTTSVAFINTDTLPGSREEAKGNRTVNPCEARLVSQLVEALLTVGVPASEIGVMTHYRSQLSLLKHHLRGHGAAIEMHTADRFQGRDKEVVVLSLVRSNEACSIGDLLKDWRRINVAFTRAKTKLLVVGSHGTLKGSGDAEMLARFVGLMEQRDWIYNLPADALESHLFEDSATQATTVTASAKISGTQVGRKASVKSPRKRPSVAGGKENEGPGPKRAKAGERALLKGKLITRDILNDMMDGMY